MKYFLVITIIANYSLFAFNPIKEIPEEYRNLDSIRLYTSGTIILENNFFSIPGLALINDSYEDIYVFWNNFVINDLSNTSKVKKKKQLISNEILLFDSSLNNKDLMTQYQDSLINYYPLFIKFPSKINSKRKAKLSGFSFTFDIKGISTYIKSEPEKKIYIKLTLNYLRASDIKDINEQLGIDIAKHTIFPSNTVFSSHQKVNGTYGFLECFETDRLKLDPTKLSLVLEKYIKKVETEELILVLEKDPNN